jgi:hypothetical protein
MKILDLTPEQYEEIEKLAGVNWSVDDIAKNLDIDPVEFQTAFDAPGSKIKWHYERGILLVKGKSQMELYNSAITGNVTAMQQMEKARAANKLEQVKKKAQLAAEQKKADTIQRFLQGHTKNELSPELIVYYEQMDMVRSLWQKGHNKNYIINIMLSSWDKLSFYKAKKIFDDAINFFYLDSDIKKQAWANYYADSLDVAAQICFEMSDFEQFRRLRNDAAAMRQIHVPDPPKDTDVGGKRIFIYTINPETLGLPRANRTKLAKWIDSLPDISDSGRDRLHMEAMDGQSTENILNYPIQDVEYLEVKKEEKDEN